MSVGTGTVGSGTQIKYVSWGAGDTAKAIFDGIASVMEGSGGWTISSSGSGTFYNTYYANATTDIRRVYQSPLLAQGSGLSTKYVMLRVATHPNIAIVGGAAASGFLRIQLIPFQSWSQNGGNDQGTNQAGQPIINNSPAQNGFDSDFLTIFSPATKYNAPNTVINNTSAGIVYIGFASNAAYLVMWPYFSVNGQLFNSQRLSVLVYGEVSEDVASYQNCPPVYVTTLQRMCSFNGIIPSAADGYLGLGSTSGSSVLGANNTFVGSLHGTVGWTAETYMIAGGTHPGPLWLSPAAPGSSTGFTGIANTIRTGVQASAFQRMMLGHLGEFGCTTFHCQDTKTTSIGTTIVRGDGAEQRTYSGGHNVPKYQFMAGANYVYNAGNTYTSSGGTALNSTNFKGIEPILGGGLLNFNTYGASAALVTAYGSNPFPLMWQWGRMRGLKFVGAPPNPATTWSTLDTVSMTVDADGFYTKTGGTATNFALIGFAPYKLEGNDWGAGDNSANMFWAIPA